MDEEMKTLAYRGTWELISAPTVTVFGYRWVFTLKYRPDGSVDRYKARLVAKSYTQTYGIDYFETFSPVVRMNSIRILFSIVVNLSGHCSNWILRMLSYMGIFRRKFIWSNPQAMLLRGDKSLSSQESHI